MDDQYFEQWDIMEYNQKKLITSPNSVLN